MFRLKLRQSCRSKHVGHGDSHSTGLAAHQRTGCASPGSFEYGPCVPVPVRWRWVVTKAMGGGGLFLFVSHGERWEFIHRQIGPFIIFFCWAHPFLILVCLCVLNSLGQISFTYNFAHYVGIVSIFFRKSGAVCFCLWKFRKKGREK